MSGGVEIYLYSNLSSIFGLSLGSNFGSSLSLGSSFGSSLGLNLGFSDLHKQHGVAVRVSYFRRPCFGGYTCEL